MVELKDFMIRLVSDPRVCQVIAIVVVEIPEAYDLLSTRDLSQNLQGYFATNWSHLWLPYKGTTNQIKVDNEAHMKHTLIELEGQNEPINFVNSILGNCFLETVHGCYVAHPSSLKPEKQSKLLHCTRTDEMIVIQYKQLAIVPLI
jgi:hypothetical protein